MSRRLEARDSAGVGRLAGEIAAQCALTPEQVRLAAQETARRVAAHMQRVALSRGGLADLVAALGDARFLSGDGKEQAVMLFLSGSEERARALVAAVGQKARLSHEQAERAVPKLVHAQFQTIVEGSRPALNDLFGRLPSLFQWSLGGMHADIADIVRRRCGAGPYGRIVLRRRLRAILAEAAGYSGRSATGWYMRSLLAPVRTAARSVASAMK